jgi:hypothetical protein
VRYHFINAEKTNHSISLLCKAFNVSQSGFHAWQRRSMSLRQREDMILLAYIRSIHFDNYQSYGRERMTKELRGLGFVVSERRVSRLMKDNNIHIKRTHKFKRTTNNNRT